MVSSASRSLPPQVLRYRMHDNGVHSNPPDHGDVLGLAHGDLCRCRQSARRASPARSAPVRTGSDCHGIGDPVLPDNASPQP